MRGMRVLVVVLFSLLLAPAARAAEVARSGDVSLGATHERGDRICIVTFAARAQTGETCGRTPYTGFRVIDVSGSDDWYGLAVDERTAAVEVDGRRFAAHVAAGFDARFVLLRLPRPRPVLRLLAANGTVIGAVQQLATDDLRFPSHNVLRIAGARVAVAPDRELRATPLRYDRVVAQRCVRLLRGRSVTASCLDLPATDEIRSVTLPPCGALPGLLAGIAPASARTVAVTLGSGRVLRAGTHPALGVRAYALALPGGEAIRGARAADRAGVVVATERLLRAPLRAHCLGPNSAEFSSFDLGLGFLAGLHAAGPEQVAAEAGGHRLLVADANDPSALCAGLDRITRVLGCGPPSLDPELAIVTRQGAFLAGIFGPDVARVDLRLADDTVQQVATTSAPGYTGRFAGRLRFLFVAQPDRVRRAVLRDAAGHVLNRSEVLLSSPDLAVTHRRLAGVGITARHLEFGTDTQRRAGLCAEPVGLSFADVGLPPARLLCDWTAAGRPVLVLAGCERTRIAILGVVAPGVRPRIILGDGRAFRPLIARLGGARLWIARPPRGAAVTRIVFGARHRSLALPPRAQQCGYLDLRF